MVAFVVAAGRPATGVAPDAGRLALGVGLALALAQAGVGFGFEGTFVTWTRSAVSGGGAFVLSRSSAGGTVITSAADA